MPENTRYIEARRSAQKALELTPDSPCKIGIAQCCSADTPILREDADLILESFRSGKIDPIVGRKITANLDNPIRRGVCPFLDGDKRCMVYEDRPLLCMIYGTGGLPMSPASTIKLQTAKAGATFNRVELECMACTSCSKELVRTTLIILLSKLENWLKLPGICNCLWLLIKANLYHDLLGENCKKRSRCFSQSCLLAS